MQFADLLIFALEEKVKARRLVGMPVSKFAKEILHLDLWEKQHEINSLMENPENRRIYVKTGHGVGKTLTAAILTMHALACSEVPPVVITTAPSYRQIHDQIWKEIRGRWNSTPELRALGEARGTRITISDSHYAHGFSTNQPERFQGIHAASVKFIIDEANGFPNGIWASIESCATGKYSQILAIGNAVLPYGEFYNGFQTEHSKGVSLTVSSRLHPNVVSGEELIRGAVTREWIEDIEEKYKEQPQIIASRVDAIFPSSSEYSIIRRDWVQDSYITEPKTHWPTILSCDIARFGSNLTVCSLFHGASFDDYSEWGQLDTVQSAEKIEQIFLHTHADLIVIDDDGVGGGVSDILIHKKYPVYRFQGGTKASNEDLYVNRISEAWWKAREFFEGRLGKINKKNSTLELQLCSREYTFAMDKKIQIEKKKDYCERTGFPSPDHADSFVMGVWGLFNEWSSATRR
jgi:hypothetical protein